ncbi:BlaR1 family beta-lactam sensor/signal transducer [Bacillus horti]|uniref:Bla regulator protein BlaR1 n=1 Tax=Caldalkalibacillus horti TaxID=77523 RepID=A0ABT9VVH9_9BACI|nr:BlaR1 family beta-lactam sensor/signal transducer [Bacillus horti]MDQ0164900.1 bla regulator protein BlaR1 [Bacillus horti]
MIFTQFVISLLISSTTVAIIMLVKKVFQKQLSTKWQYGLWFLLMAALALPFLPTQLFTLERQLPLLDAPLQQDTGSLTTNEIREAVNINWLQDFTTTVNQATPTFLNNLTAWVWTIGAVVMTILTLIAWLRLNKIKRTALSLNSTDIIALLEQCKQLLKISRKITVVESALVKSPMIFGLFKTYLVFPANFSHWLSEEELKYIFLHELSHYKNKDHWTTYLTVLFQLVYWFNPLVWIAFREMRLDREIACDHAVLQILDKSCHITYGHTLLRFAHKASQPNSLPIPLTSQLASKKKHLKRRLEKIVMFKQESILLKVKSTAIFLLVALLLALQAPLVSVLAKEELRYDFNEEQTIYENLSSYFAENEASFVLYNSQTGQYTIHNEEQSKRRVSPVSTYKIFSLLFGLESGVITKEQSTLSWNGDIYPYEAWNGDHDLFSAMESSVNWYFQKLDGALGSTQLQDYLVQLGYGNTDISGGIQQHWLESSLKISPIEQVQLLEAFYTNKLGFDEENIETVKEAIQLEESEGTILSGKTGTGSIDHSNVSGWFVGYVEKNGDTFFFATNIQGKNHISGSSAANITLSILKDKGIY